MDTILQQALVFIGASVVLVPIFRWLGLGAVLGYLVAGILVGPDVLGLIHDAESVIHFSELGVIFLLFLIGLEIHPGKLWGMRKHLVGLGGVQIVSCSLVFFGFGLLVGLDMTTAAVLGFALSLSSTAFAIQTLTEKNQFNTEFGRSSFAVLLMQDLVAIPALAVIPAIGMMSPSTPTLQGSAAILSLIGLIIASRFLIRPVFRFIASTRTREIFTAATLLVVLGVSALMLKVGLSAALGTFIAGVLLADSEYRHEIEANLEPFKSLLMGLFFIAVGMGVSLDVIAARPLLVVSLAVGYMTVKALLIYASGRLFSLSHANSKMMALTISQGGEFAFVIFAIALQSKLAESETLALLTVVITISMAMSPIVGLLSERVLRAAKTKLKPEYDKIEDEAPEIIIAGLGRFGQMFGRLLRAQGIRFVSIDHDSDQIELLRRFGNKVYYGDASRLDLLQAAGAARAKYFVIAIDDAEKSLAAARIAKEHFPNLTIFARARNRGHAFELMELGVPHIKRETFDSSVQFVGDLLVDRGMPRARVDNLIEKFKRHDEIMLKEQFKVRSDDQMFISVSNQGTAQLAQVLREDDTRTYIDEPAAPPAP
ncbi:MAG: monovalent cation:proton antiporter-2 (CPA2) family protein [Bdellovibrionota bacterium]